MVEHASETDLEVVKYDPIEALDRVLSKEKKKKRKQQQQLKEIVDSGDGEETTLECQGQELLWVEEVREAESETPPPPSAKKRFFKLRKKNKVPEVTHQVDGKVVLVTSVPKEVQRQALLKAHYARELLHQALQISKSQDLRDEKLKEAFTEAVEARRMVDPDAQIEPSRSLGEKEALEASRVMSVSEHQRDPLEDYLNNPDIEELGEEKKDDGSSTSPLKGSPQKERSPVKPRSLVQIAAEHTEAARRYLESLLPEFMDQVVSDGEEEAEPRNAKAPAINVVAAEKEADGAEGAEATNDQGEKVRRRRRRAAAAKQATNDQGEKVRRRRAAAAKQATIARIVQQNNDNPRTPLRLCLKNIGTKPPRDVQTPNATISTLGFDNTYQGQDDVLTIGSLNAFMDAPFSMEERSPKHVPAVDATALRAADTHEHASTPGCHRPSSFGLFGRSYSKKKAFSIPYSKSFANHKTPKAGTVQRFNASVLTVGEVENKPNMDEHGKYVEIQDIERVTANQLKNAVEKDKDGRSITSWNGVPQHGRNPPVVLMPYSAPEEGEMPRPPPTISRQKESPRDPSKLQTQFIPAPRLDARVMTDASWDKLAAGHLLRDVVPHASASWDKGAVAGEIHKDEDAHTVSAREGTNAESVSSRHHTSPFRKRATHLFQILGRKISKSTKKESLKTVDNLNVYEDSDLIAARELDLSLNASIFRSQDHAHDDVAPTNTTEYPSEDHQSNGEPNLSSALSGVTEDSYLRAVGDADRYTAMTDLEDSVHREAQRRLKEQKPIISDVDLMPEKATIGPALRKVFSWEPDLIESTTNAAVKPTFAEIDGEGLVLANKGEILDAIEMPHVDEENKSATTGKQITRATSTFKGGKTSESFEEELLHTKELIATQRERKINEEKTADENESHVSVKDTPTRKRRFGRLFKHATRV